MIWASDRRDALALIALLALASSLPDVVVQALLALELLERVKDDNSERELNGIRRTLVSAALLCSAEAKVDWQIYQNIPEWFASLAARLFPETPMPSAAE